MIRFTPLLLVTVSVLLSGSHTESKDQDAVRTAVEDYVKALYDAEPDRIHRSVHPALEKLGTYRSDQSKEYNVPGKMTFEQLVDLAGRWNRDGQMGRDLQYEIDVYEVLDMTASAKLTAKWGIDYMHLIKQGGTWKIVQILWQSHPAKG